MSGYGVIIHGYANTGVYRVWSNMLARCRNKNHRDYKRYGAIGIKVCRRWQESFVFFLEDMGDRPPNMTLDRIDNKKGYCKSNCRWASWTTQQRNRSNNKLNLAKAKQIVALVKKGESKLSVAKKFSVSHKLVRQIVGGKLWKEASL